MRISNFNVNRPVFVPPAWVPRMPTAHGRVAPGYARLGSICLPLARGRAVVCHHARPFHHHIVNCNRCAVANLQCGRVRRVGC
jgi:hypothetical protein